jgi:hypothetical protein
MRNDGFNEAAQADFAAISQRRPGVTGGAF